MTRADEDDAPLADPDGVFQSLPGGESDEILADAPRVLIVDDDPDFLAIAELSLQAYGFRVERATGGLRGVFLATQQVPDAVLCDLRMPGIDGFVVAEALRTDPATERVAIFACTGRRDLEAKASPAQNASPFDAVFVKPVDWDEVALALAQTIELKRQAAQTAEFDR